MHRMAASIQISDKGGSIQQQQHLHIPASQDLLFEIEIEPNTANFNDDDEETNTTVDIQLTILNGLKIDDDYISGTFVDKFEITSGNLYFRVTLPNKKSVMRRQEHFQKLRNVVAIKWGAFVPVMDPFNQKTNEMKLFMMNEFLRESFKYEFIVKSKEFQATFDPT